MITIHNDDLDVEIDEKGAQPHSIRYQGNEYLWQGDPASWKRQAPVLFPFVGRLKNDEYQYQGKTYHQTQHGFARDERFTVIDKAPDKVVMQLHDNERTRQAYPFKFELTIRYQLDQQGLKVSYDVYNTSQEKTLIYAIGAHPGFNVPLNSQGDFTHQQVEVDPATTYSRIKLVAPGPYNDLEHPQTIDLSTPLMLNHDLFQKDAIVLSTHEKPVTVTVTDQSRQHGVHVQTLNNKYIGIWSPYPAKANLLCIEPWWGIADGIDGDGQLVHKQSMEYLSAGAHQQYQFSIQPF